MHYFQWNIGDYASHTRHLSLLEDLAYRRLLDVAYLQEQPLPEDVSMCARLVGMRDHMDELTAVLDEFFQFESGVGYTHERVDAEIAKTGRKRELARKAGKASAKKRAADVEQESNGRSTPVQRTFNGPATDVQPPITHNPLPLPDRSTGVDPAGFDEWWAAYPKKVGKQAARRAWKKLKPGPVTMAPKLLAAAKAFAAAVRNPQFVPNPATWLNEGRWDDDLKDSPACKFSGKGATGASHSTAPVRHNTDFEFGDLRCSCSTCKHHRSEGAA